MNHLLRVLSVTLLATVLAPHSLIHAQERDSPAAFRKQIMNRNALDPRLGAGGSIEAPVASKTSAADTYFTFDESFLQAVAVQYNVSSGMEPVWSTFEIIQYERTAQGSPLVITQTGREPIGPDDYMEYREIMQFEYDEQGRLERATDRYEQSYDGVEEGFTYGANLYAYDESGRLSTFTEVYYGFDPEAQPDTVLFTFTYGDSGTVTVEGTSPNSGESFMAILTEGENQLVVEGEFDDGAQRITYFGVQTVLEYFVGSYSDVFTDWAGYLEEEYDPATETYSPVFRTRHEIVGSVVTIHQEDWMADEEVWETWERVQIQLDGDGMPLEATSAYVYDEETYMGERFLFNPDADALQFTSVEEEDGSAVLPTAVELSQNYPNPFNPATQIRFGLPQAASDVTLSVYDLLGRQVANLIDARALPAGWHEVSFDASRLPSGQYIYTLSTSGQKVSKSLTLIK